MTAQRASEDSAYYAKLKRAVSARRALFAPSAEKRGLQRLLGELA